MSEVGSSGKLNCILCNGVVSVKNGDQARFADHMRYEHETMSESGIAYVLAGCRMTEEERTAVVQLMRDKRTEGQRGVEAMEEDGEEITMDEHIPTENIEINDVYAAGVETLNQLVDNIQEIGSGEDIADESFLEVVTEELGEVMPEPEEVGTVEEITLDGEPTTKIVTNDFIEKHTPKKLIPQKSLIDENDKSNEIKEALKNPKSRRGPGKMKLSLKVDMMCSTPNKLQTPSPLEEKPVVRCPTRGCDRLFRDHKLLTKHTAHCGNAEANEMKAMESSEADIEVEITSAVGSESVAFTSDEEVKTSEGSPPRTKSKIKCKFCPSFLNSMAALNKHCIKKHGQTESVKQETIPEVNEEGNREVKVEGKPGVKGKKGIKGRKIVEKLRVKGVKNEQEASGGSTETDEELVRQLLQRDPEVDVSTSSYFQSHPTMIVSLPSARLQMPNFIQNIKVAPGLPENWFLHVKDYGCTPSTKGRSRVTREFITPDRRLIRSISGVTEWMKLSMNYTSERIEAVKSVLVTKKDRKSL